MAGAGPLGRISGGAMNCGEMVPAATVLSGPVTAL
jgi:hypothetical protein